MATTERSPHITQVLQEAREDLEDAEFPRIVGRFLNPIRDGILVPVTSRAEEIVPVVVDAIPLPFVDEVGAFAIKLPIKVAKIVYSVIPRKSVGAEAAEELSNEFDRAFHTTRIPMPLVANAFAVVGFTVNTAIDIATLPFGNKLGKWIDSLKKFLGFLTFSGVGNELLDGFANFNTLENMLIIGRTQETRDRVGTLNSRRGRTAFSFFPEGLDHDKFREIMAYSTYYCKWASAAYGVAMIDNANLLQAVNTAPVIGAPASVMGVASDRARMEIICRYCGIRPRDIITMQNPGGNHGLVNHFIAVHGARGIIRPAVVLSIRGTYTISGLITDALAYSTEFCGGRAHHGIATAANNLWAHVQGDIIRTLLDNPGHDLVLSGHSLGAGTAALLALKLKYEGILANENESLKNVNIRCYAFANPPVYYKEDKDEEMKEAMSSIYSFIHESDCVPFASVDAIRRISDLLVRVDNYPTGIFGSSTLMAAGLRPIPMELEEIIFNDADLVYANDSEKLAVPSPFVTWMRAVRTNPRNKKPEYDAMFCRPEGVNDMKGTNDLNFLINENMISDHMNPNYELATASIREQLLRGATDVYSFASENPEEEYN